MRHRILATALVLAATLVPARALPAQLLGGIIGTFQRAQMIVNQATQIANQIRQMRTMTRQLSELEEQLEHMKQAARGEVDALIEPFSELAAGSIGLVGEGLGWGSEFSGAAGELVDAVRGMGSQLVQCQVRHCSLQAPVLALELLQAPCPWLTFIPPYSRLHR